MKKNKLKLFITILLLLIPINVYASDGETNKLYINMDIKEDGSLDVKELASLDGNYNGRFRSIFFANLSAQTFTGVESDFESSDIYNGSALTDLLLYDVAGRDNITFSSLFDSSLRSGIYQESSSGSNGSRGIYTKNTSSNGIDLKIFNPSSSDSSFYLEYTIKDAVVVHNDVAELAWNILGDEYEDNIYDMEVHVNLPSSDESLRVWLRGPLNGYIENVDNQYAKITYDFLGARNAVSTRLMFNKNLVPYATKYSHVDGKDMILKVEKKAADKANAERERIKMQNMIVKVITVIWYLSLLVVAVLFFHKKKDSEKTDFHQDYLRDFPAEYGPEIVSYLMKHSVNESAMSASILMIIEKKALKAEKDSNEKDNYKLIKQPDRLADLTEEELEILTMLIDEIGDGTTVTLKQIKTYGRSESKAKKFINRYDKWKNHVSKKAESEGFFQSFVSIQVIAGIVCFIGFFVFFTNLICETSFILGYLSIFVGIVCLFIFLLVHFRTAKGSLQYQEWMALKKFMVDFGTMDEKELPEIQIWGKYLVYATVLGCAKQLEKTMKIRIQSMNIDQSMASYYLMDSFTDNLYIMSNITSSVNNSIASAVATSRSSIAASSSSSGGGFGGGASSGGGSFGGGGGGGHF